jgi:putative redox protein
MAQEINCEWAGGMAFESKAGGHTLRMDAGAEVGGQDSGLRPKPLLLTSLAGCTGMDIVSLLTKMRVQINKFNIDIKGDLTDEHPRYYHRIHVIYTFQGENLDREKVEKAVKLSQDKYCGVSAMLRKAAELTYEIRYE